MRAKDNSAQARDRGLTVLRGVAQLIAQRLGSEVTELPVQGGMAKFTAMLRTQPWAHVKVSALEPTTIQ